MYAALQLLRQQGLLTGAGVLLLLPLAGRQERLRSSALLVAAGATLLLLPVNKHVLVPSIPNFVCPRQHN